MSYQFITNLDSPNFGKYHVGEVGQNIPKMIIIHHWGQDGQTFENVVNWLCNPRSQVSAHLVAEAGRVACLVDYSNVAWHAGNMDANSTSIGIECRPECAHADFETVAELISDLWKTFGKIPIYGHKDFGNTACPGRWYPLLSALRQRAEYYYNPKISEIKKPNIDITRYSGKNRFETANILSNAFPTGNKVIVHPDSFADGISAVQIVRFKNTNIVFDQEGVGGGKDTYMVGSASHNPGIAKMLSGSDRYDTNLECLKEVMQNDISIAVVSGNDWPDGISAISLNMPILMVNNVYLTRKQAKLLDRHKGLNFVCVGGIRSDMIKQLSEYGSFEILSGENRFNTSILTAEKFGNTDAVILVDNWVDGILASTIKKYPIILVDQNNTDHAKRYCKRRSIKKVIAVGGIPDSTIYKIFN